VPQGAVEVSNSPSPTTATVTHLIDWRNQRVEQAAGPWWGGYCCHTWSLAEASRGRWSA